MNDPRPLPEPPIAAQRNAIRQRTLRRVLSAIALALAALVVINGLARLQMRQHQKQPRQLPRADPVAVETAEGITDKPPAVHPVPPAPIAAIPTPAPLPAKNPSPALNEERSPAPLP